MSSFHVPGEGGARADARFEPGLLLCSVAVTNLPGQAPSTESEALRLGPICLCYLQDWALLPPSTSTLALEGSSAAVRGAPADFRHALWYGLWRLQVEVRAASDSSSSYPAFFHGSESSLDLSLLLSSYLISWLFLWHLHPGIGLPHPAGL